MAETKMNVALLAHTQLTKHFTQHIIDNYVSLSGNNYYDSDGQAVALTAIRTCYSPHKPSEIVALEGAKYFGKQATDGEGGTEADRLIRHIVRSRHLSTLEHLTFTFAIEGVSRAFLAQLTRHRVGFSYSVQSQRYVRFGSGDKSGGFDYVVPDSVTDDKKAEHMPGQYFSAKEFFEGVMDELQYCYDKLREAGVPAEDARAVLPQATATNLVMTVNLRSLLDFYAKRQHGKGAQSEIADLAEALKREVVAVEPWTAQFFE